MPLHLIQGPPNTGRTDVLERSFRDQVDRGNGPFLVVPGVDDIFDWERRLTGSDEQGNAQALAGGRIMHFRDLCREILSQGGERPSDGASELRRQHFVRKALHREWGSLADRIESQPGLPASVLELIDEFRAEMIDPVTLEERVSASGLLTLSPLVGVYAAYLDLLTAEAGMSDGPRDAERALKAVSRCWGNRPLFLAGFDDMTPQQIEMVTKISVDAGATVTVAVTHEEGNPALEWTNKLVSNLRESNRTVEPTSEQTSRSDRTAGHQPALRALEREFMRSHATAESLKPSKSVTVMRSSGSRNEAEAIGAGVARLLADDFTPDDGDTIPVEPGDIAIAVSSPAEKGVLIRDVLARYGIPVSLEAETPARHTTAGQTILSILASIAPGAGVGPALSWLRSPLGPDPDEVDPIEFRARTDDYSSAEQVFRSLGGPLCTEWEKLTETVARKQPVNEAIARLARETGARLLARDRNLPPTQRTVVEVQVAEAIAAAAEDLADIQDSSSSGLAEIRAAIETDAITVWTVPAVGTVRIASPYSLRAKRFKHLFMAAQQEGGIRDLDRSGPFLSRSDRSGLVMSERRDPEVQERYLFYSCLTVPTDGLWISCQTSDETGKAEQPSPLVRSVEDLFRESEAEESRVNRGGRSGSDIVFAPGDAPSFNELARSLAPRGDSVTPILEDDRYPAMMLDARLDTARSIESETKKLRDIGLPEILAEIRREPVFGATAVEAYAGCPYRWFIERQLRPTDFGPRPDYLAMGELVHAVLEDLFGRYLDGIRAAEGEREPKDVEPLSDLYGGGSPDAWLESVPEYVERRAPEVGLGGSDPASRGSRIRASALVSDYLSRESIRFNQGPHPHHSVAELELGFGTAEAKGEAIDMGEWKLVGLIDRVDLSAGTGTRGREAVAIDYKTGSVDGLGQEAAEKTRRIQLALYLHALRSMGYSPVACLYVPLRQDGGTSRGAYSAVWKGEMMRRGASKADCLDEIEEFIDRGVGIADEAVEGMFAGALEHDPATCPNHFAHAAVPDSGAEGDED